MSASSSNDQSHRRFAIGQCEPQLQSSMQPENMSLITNVFALDASFSAYVNARRRKTPTRFILGHSKRVEFPAACMC